MCFEMEDQAPVAKPVKKVAKKPVKKVTKKPTKKTVKRGVRTEKPINDLVPQDLESLLGNIESEIELEQSGIAEPKSKKVAKSA